MTKIFEEPTPASTVEEKTPLKILKDTLNEGKRNSLRRISTYFS